MGDSTSTCAKYQTRVVALCASTAYHHAIIVFAKYSIVNQSILWNPSLVRRGVAKCLSVGVALIFSFFFEVNSFIFVTADSTFLFFPTRRWFLEESQTS